MIDQKLLQGEIQRLDTRLREERERAKQIIGALEITLDEVRGHAVEIDRTRRALTALTETMRGMIMGLESSRNGHEVEAQVLNG